MCSSRNARGESRARLRARGSRNSRPPRHGRRRPTRSGLLDRFDAATTPSAPSNLPPRGTESRCDRPRRRRDARRAWPSRLPCGSAWTSSPARRASRQRARAPILGRRRVRPVRRPGRRRSRRARRGARGSARAEPSRPRKGPEDETPGEGNERGQEERDRPRRARDERGEDDRRDDPDAASAPTAGSRSAAPLRAAPASSAAAANASAFQPIDNPPASGEGRARGGRVARPTGQPSATSPAAITTPTWRKGPIRERTTSDHLKTGPDPEADGKHLGGGDHECRLALSEPVRVVQEDDAEADHRDLRVDVHTRPEPRDATGGRRATCAQASKPRARARGHRRHESG